MESCNLRKIACAWDQAWGKSRKNSLQKRVQLRIIPGCYQKCWFPKSESSTEESISVISTLKTHTHAKPFVIFFPVHLMSPVAFQKSCSSWQLLLVIATEIALLEGLKKKKLKKIMENTHPALKKAEKYMILSTLSIISFQQSQISSRNWYKESTRNIYYHILGRSGSFLTVYFQLIWKELSPSLYYYFVLYARLNIKITYFAVMGIWIIQ